MRGALLALVFLLSLAAPGASEEITARLTSEAFYTDEPVGVVVEIGDVDETVTALELRVPDGFTAEGPIQRGRRQTILNGVSRSWTEFLFRVQAAPDTAGRFTLGPLVVTYRSGRTREVEVGAVRVAPRPGGGVKFVVEADPPGGPIALPFVVTYRVLYSGEAVENRDAFGDPRTPLGLTSLDLALLERSDLRVDPVEPEPGSSARTIRLSSNRQVHVAPGHVEVDGTLYRALTFGFRVTPLAVEDIDLSGRVGLSLADGYEQREGPFGRVRRVPKVREARAATGPATYRVEPLPEEGRPRGFSGAVGRFTIEAVPAETEVNAFDPIPVTVTVRGEGVLDRVALPRWSEMPEIARDFELTADVDPGRMAEGAKVFEVTFRARSSAVTELPPLPLPYYDPWREAYAVARSEPTPITVRDVKTVRPEDAVGHAAAPTPGVETPERRLGIGANFETLGESAGALRARPPLFTPGFVLLLVVPPVLAGAWIVVSRLRARPRVGPRGTPLSRALGRLDEDPPWAFGDYFRERLDLGPGEITTRELESALTARLVPAETTERVAAAHEELVAARFAGGEPPVGLEGLLREVDRCLG